MKTTVYFANMNDYKALRAHYDDNLKKRSFKPEIISPFFMDISNVYIKVRKISVIDANIVPYLEAFQAKPHMYTPYNMENSTTFINMLQRELFRDPFYIPSISLEEIHDSILSELKDNCMFLIRGFQDNNKQPIPYFVETIGDSVAYHNYDNFFKNRKMYNYVVIRNQFLQEQQLTFDQFSNYKTCNITESQKKACEAFLENMSKN